MHKLFVLVLLSVLSIALGKLALVIKQVVDDKEVALKTTRVVANQGENLKFNCYVDLGLRNITYSPGKVDWQTPSYADNFEINGSVLVIQNVDWINEGDYFCFYTIRRLYKDFHLQVKERIIPFVHREYPDIDKYFDDGSLFVLPNYTKYDLPKIYYHSSYTDKGPIFFIPAVIVIILGILRMGHYLRSRRNATWQRLRTSYCNHRLCAHRRRTDPTASCLLQTSSCLLQTSSSSRVSIVIVGRVAEGGIENPTSECDGPPTYNEVIPQDLPPTYTEAVQNSANETPSENRT